MRISDWSSDVCSSDLVPRANHERYEVVAKAAEQKSCEQVDDHDHAVHRNILQVVFRLNPGNRPGKPQLEPHQYRKHQCHQADANGRHSILDRDDLVILATYTLPYPGLGMRSEARRVGKACASTGRYRWSSIHEKKI